MLLTVKFVVLAALFVGTGGAVFTDWGRRFPGLVMLAGFVAVLASAFLFHDLYKTLKQEVLEEAISQTSPQDDPSGTAEPSKVPPNSMTAPEEQPAALEKQAAATAAEKKKLLYQAEQVAEQDRIARQAQEAEAQAAEAERLQKQADRDAEQERAAKQAKEAAEKAAANEKLRQQSEQAAEQARVARQANEERERQAALKHLDKPVVAIPPASPMQDPPVQDCDKLAASPYAQVKMSVVECFETVCGVN